MITNRIKNWGINILNDIKPNDKSDKFILGTAVVLFLFTAFYSFFSDIMYDEAYTYTYYANRRQPLFLAFSFLNNHPFNSLLIYLFSFLVPDNEFFIRLPNLLFLILYLIYAIRISKKITKDALAKALVFSCLALYYFLIPNYFSLARGYGISSTLVLIFIYNISTKEQDFKQIVTNFYILLLATFTFTALIPLVASVAVYYVLFEIKFKLIKFIKFAFLDLGLMLFGFSWTMFNLIAASADGKPLPSSVDGFLESTIGSYLTSFSDFLPNTENKYFLILFAVIIVMSFAFFFIQKPKQVKISFILILTFLLFFIGSTISGRPHITERGLIPFFSIFILSLIELVKLSCNKLTIKRTYFLIAQGILTSLIITNFIYNSCTKNLFTNRGDHKEKIFKDLDIYLTHENPYSNIKFYLEKFKTNPPVERIKSDSTFTEVQLTKTIKGFYSFKKRLLLLEASDNADTGGRFSLHIKPKNKKHLSSIVKKNGFDNNNFSWEKSYRNSNYKVIILPEYKIKSFKISQFKGKENKWHTSIINNNHL